MICHGSAGPKFDTTNLTQVDEGHVFGFDRLTAEREPVSNLLEQGTDAVAGQNTLLAVAVLVSAGLDDDVLDTRFGEDERCGIFGNVDMRAVADDAFRAVLVDSTLIVDVFENPRTHSRMLVEWTCCDDFLPQVRKCAAD